MAAREDSRSVAVRFRSATQGVDIATVSERLGHSSVATTADTYVHAIRGKDHAAALSWDEIIQRAQRNPLV